jgi:biopolymer transport protein ExbB
LIGLLGTVLGIIQVLTRIEASAPLIHAGDVGQGLWQALITTAAGLAVAIPTYTAYNLLVGRVEAVVLDMERASGEIVSYLLNPRAWGDVG